MPPKKPSKKAKDLAKVLVHNKIHINLNADSQGKSSNKPVWIMTPESHSP